MKLKVGVLVKQVPDHETIIQIKSENELDIEDRYVCSFFDEIAIEAALNIKKNHPDTEIFAISAGGKKMVDALRRAISMGIDQVEHVGDEIIEGADCNYVAQALAARLKVLHPDLIICGKQSGDSEFGAIGPMVAELLQIPHVSSVISLEIDIEAGKVSVGKEMEGEIWVRESHFPLLITAEKGFADPHVPMVTRVMKAMKSPIKHIPLEELDLHDKSERALSRHIRYVAPPERPEVTMMQNPFPQNVMELVENLKKKGVLS